MPGPDQRLRGRERLAAHPDVRRAAAIRAAIRQAREINAAGRAGGRWMKALVARRWGRS